jgi:hypothetical protein
MNFPRNGILSNLSLAPDSKRDFGSPPPNLSRAGGS